VSPDIESGERAQEKGNDAVTDNLKVLGIVQLVQWDVLMFVHDHATSLGSVERVSSLLGYGVSAVGEALDSLTSSGLLERSHNSRGVRLYRVAGSISGDTRQRALRELRKVTKERAGRLLLIDRLRQAAPGMNSRRQHGLHLA
jgi:DNA-binding MarR family transcriptional regulator